MNAIVMEGLTALIAGMGTVFAILILISLVLGLFEYIDPKARRDKQLQKMQKKVVVEKVAVKEEAPSMEPVVAAISVALATKLNVSVDRLVIRDIRRV